jgi:amidase
MNSHPTVTKKASTKTSKANKPSPTLRLANAILSDIADGLNRGTFTSGQLTEAYLARISEINSASHAVIETTSNAIENVRHLDCERHIRSTCGALHGLPIVLKDNVPTLHDSTETTCGSFALLDNRTA